MLSYKIGTKVVLKPNLTSAQDFFSDDYVLITDYYLEGTPDEHYGIEPVDGSNYSFVDDKDIDHKATELLNSK